MTRRTSETRFIFITGGVVSSLGKGIAAASLGALLQARGYKVRLRKLDPYLNVDPGTMNPIQHGEVFVTNDGMETDLDLGHYERFTGVEARKGDSVSAGRIYSDLLARERQGEYLGGTVQVIPHVTNLIKEFILNGTEDSDFIICEIGGTVGDIEGLPFFEAIRQLGYELGKERTLYIHLTLVPYIAAAKELKTKPTQHSVKELRSIGILPHILLCRSEREIPISDRRKIAQFCNVPVEGVIQALDTDTIYKVPINYHKEGLDTQVLKAFNLPCEREPDLSQWERVVAGVASPKKNVTIAMVGKYNSLSDAYKSLLESIAHAGIAGQINADIRWVNARRLNYEEAKEQLHDVDAILVPGGFGQSGAEGKMNAARVAREMKIPYLGICFGMQMAVLEYARNVLGIEKAYTSEFISPKEMDLEPVVGLMTEWTKDGSIQRREAGSAMGGTMRLGSYDCALKDGSLAAQVYNAREISERHRHRYEVNVHYKDALEKAGMVFSGMSPDGDLPEIVEIKSHPWFIGVQFHPEFKSRAFAPHPLFVSFLKAAEKHKEPVKVKELVAK